MAAPLGRARETLRSAADLPGFHPRPSRAIRRSHRPLTRGVDAILRDAGALRARGLSTTIGFWNAAEQDSEAVAEEYLTSLERVCASGLDCLLSIKPLALAFRPELLTAVVDRARELDMRLQFDSPSAESADIAFAAIREAAHVHTDIGCTLPGRWQRSLDDAEWAIHHGVSIRVVKGQWADPENPLRDTRAGFLAVIDRLAGRARRVSVATHDADLAHEAISHLRAHRTSCELELMMSGPPPRVMSLARTLDVPVRAYLPYGEGEVAWTSVRRPGL